MKKVFGIIAALIVCALLVLGAAFLGGAFDNQGSDNTATQMQSRPAQNYSAPAVPQQRQAAPPRSQTQEDNNIKSLKLN